MKGIKNENEGKKSLHGIRQSGIRRNEIRRNGKTPSKCDRVRFLIFVLVFVSRDFELCINVSCEESTVSLIWG